MKGRISIGKEELESLIKVRYQLSDNWMLTDIIIPGFDVNKVPHESRSCEIKSLEVMIESVIDDGH